MNRLLGLDCYRQRVVKESAVEAVCLDEESESGSLGIQVWDGFGRMHRCDYYKVVERGSSKILILIEKTDFAKSVTAALRRFEDAMDEFSKEFYRTDLRKLYEQISERLPYRMFWPFIFRELCEEHAAKAQATMFILEHLRGIDEDLTSAFSYSRIHYMLLIPNVDNEGMSEKEIVRNELMLQEIIEMMENRLAATFVTPKCLTIARESEFERKIGESMKR